MKKTNNGRFRISCWAAICASAALAGTPLVAQSANDQPPPPATEGSAEDDATPLLPYYGNIDPFYGNIDPFYGNIDPFYGNIDPFWGNINPFYGNIDPFYGNISPFWGNIDPFVSGNAGVAPAWGNIQPFWETVGTRWNAAQSAWAQASANDPATLAGVATSLREIVSLSEATWGAAVTAKTGASFGAGFAAPLLAKFGIDLDNPATLAALTPSKRAEFFLAWYDGLMAYSGRDRVDHWMATANWNPALTQQQGGGADTVIGLLDAKLDGVADLASRVVQSTGRNGFVNGHGAGVASLMVAAHDGDGVMGIAPRASVVHHNPFDGSGTANWADVRAGIIALKAQNASIINASLGQSGKVLPQAWNGIFGNLTIAARKHDTVYVIAAGNEGLTQTGNINWTAAQGTHFLLVGSVDPSGNISSFSNRPGEACLLINSVCPTGGALADGGKLMNRFITAPGELILLSDGMGGTVRRSGTSFAAPIVSGAIALLHDRWPWLAKDPAASVEIILRSAKDVGAPGIDPVYGVGLLDITASQSPLNMNNLVYHKVKGGIVTQTTVAVLQAEGVRNTWEADGVYFTLFEKVGKSQRDFVVPMSSLLKGSVTTAFGGKEEFQRFLTKKLTDFIKKNDRGYFTDVASYTTPEAGGWQMSISSQDPTAYLQGSTRDVPHSAFRATAPGGAFAVSAGYGSGALALTDQRGFGMTTDFGSDSGVNPLLGIASGGSFFNTDIRLAPKTRVSFGFSERVLQAEDDLSRSPIDRNLGDVDELRAHALNMGLSHDLGEGSGLSFGARLSSSLICGVR